MARTDRLDAGNIERKLNKKKYKVTGRVGARKTRLKATGTQQSEDGVVSVHELVLDLELVNEVWQPVPPAGEDFTSASSILRSESNGCTTRAYIRNRSDLERVLVKMGALEAEIAEPLKPRRGAGPSSNTTASEAAQDGGPTVPSSTKRAKTADKPAAKTPTKTAAKPVAKRGVKKAAKPAAKRSAKPATKTAAKPAAKRGVKKAAKPAAKRSAKPATKTAAKRSTKKR